MIGFPVGIRKQNARALLGKVEKQLIVIRKLETNGRWLRVIIVKEQIFFADRDGAYVHRVTVGLPRGPPKLSLPSGAQPASLPPQEFERQPGS